jgi:predicted enzyme related to lactoylglutathione lyase
MNLESEGQITFFYYNDLERADDFYSTIMEFEKVIDLSYARVFKITEGAHVGIVNSEEGYLKPSKDKPVMLTIIVENIESWFNNLKEKGINVKEGMVRRKKPDMTTLLIKDPEDYVIEILQFNKKPYG